MLFYEVVISLFLQVHSAAIFTLLFLRQCWGFVIILGSIPGGTVSSCPQISKTYMGFLCLSHAGPHGSLCRNQSANSSTSLQLLQPGFFFLRAWGFGQFGVFFFMFSVVSSLKHCSLIMKLRRKEYSTVLGNVRQINNEAVNHS